MAHDLATVSWKRGDAVFSDGRSSRAHEWMFDGGLRVPASSSPLSVLAAESNPANPSIRRRRWWPPRRAATC